MGSYALVFPVLPGKSDTDVRSIAKMLSADPSAYREARTRSGVMLERAYLQKTPMGDFVVAYLEASGEFGPTMAAMVSSDHPVDRTFVDLVREIHGIDLRQPPAGPPPETLAAWSDPTVKTRGRGMAFSAPIAPGKTAAGREFVKKAFEVRVTEFAASRRALRENLEVITLQPTPHGDVINVYLEGVDPFDANRRFAASTSAYDVWFKEQLKEVFPPFVDFDKPVSGVEEIFDSERL